MKTFNILSDNNNSFCEESVILSEKSWHLKFVYSEKATKFCEISTLLLSTVHTDKSKVEISQNFVAFSEYMNFNSKNLQKGFEVRNGKIY